MSEVECLYWKITEQHNHITTKRYYIVFTLLERVFTLNYFDDENRIIEFFQESVKGSIGAWNNDDEAISVLESIYSPVEWKNWTCCAGKADPPPDFFCEELKLMMDVMRVDDHAFENSRGKTINPVNQRESQIQKELIQAGIYEAFPNVQAVFVNAVTNLPTKEDHNYQFYQNNFQRVIRKHIDSIAIYKENHPGYKTIFFVLDESSGYVQVPPENAGTQFKQGQQYSCMLYHHFADNRFLNTFIGSKIDFLIWFSPFKHFETNAPSELFPTTIVYNLNFAP